MTDRSEFPIGSTTDEDVATLYELFKEGEIGYTLQCPDCDNEFEIEQSSGRIKNTKDLKRIAKDSSDGMTGLASFALALGKALVSKRVLGQDEFLVRGFKVDRYEGGESELKCLNCGYQCATSRVDANLNIVRGPDYDFEN